MKQGRLRASHCTRHRGGQRLSVCIPPQDVVTNSESCRLGTDVGLLHKHWHDEPDRLSISDSESDRPNQDFDLTCYAHLQPIWTLSTLPSVIRTKADSCVTFVSGIYNQPPAFNTLSALCKDFVKYFSNHPSSTTVLQMLTHDSMDYRMSCIVILFVTSFFSCTHLRSSRWRIHSYTM